MLSAEQLEERRLGLGASEAPAALGLSPWVSPVELYLAKIGAAAPQPESLAMRLGTLLEPLVLAMFEERTGLAVTGRQRRVQDPTLPWRWATLDGLASGAVVEAKTTGDGREYGEDGTDEVPFHVLVQNQHQMACAQLELVYVPVLFLARRDFRIFRVERDDELIAAITDHERSFWRHVETRMPPPPTTAADVVALYPRDSGAAIVADEATATACKALAAVRHQIEVLEGQEEDLERRIKAAMGEVATLLGPAGKPLATWKHQVSKVLNQKAFAADHPDLFARYKSYRTTRVFRIKDL